MIAMIIDKITPFVDKNFNTISSEPSNQNSIKYTNYLSQQSYNLDNVIIKLSELL